MPMRKIACISRLLALAEPVPLTLASLNAKSFTLERVCWKCCAAMSGRHRNRRRHGERDQQLELLHVPRRGRAALGAQAAVDAEVLVLDHDAAGLRQRRGGEERLVEVDGRRGSGACAGRPPRRSRVMVRHCTGQMSMQASHSMHSGAGEDRLDVAVEAALHLARGLLGGEAQLHLDVDALEALASDRRAASSGACEGL